MSFKAVIFDCDGVIVDTETISNNILKSKLASLGLHLSDARMHELFSGFTADDTLRTASEQLGRPLPQSFKDELRYEFQQVIEKDLQPIKDIPELIARLNVPIAMATNAHRAAMEFKLEKINLIEAFKHRFCADDVEKPKPFPDLYLKAAESLKVAPADCLVIEDSVAGITAGIRAGMTVYGFSECTDEKAQQLAGAKKSFPTMLELMQELHKIGILD